MARQVRQLRQGQIASRIALGGGHRRGLFHLGAMHGHKGGAEAVDAGEILVAAALIDAALAAEFRLHGLHGDAVGLHAAIAAALANQLVYDDPLVGIGIGAALAATALFGGAGLVENQRGDAGDRSEFPLHRVQLLARADGEACGPFDIGGVFGGVVGHQHQLAHPLRRHLPGDGVHGEAAVMGLPASHGDRVVVEDLVGHVHARPDGEANGQYARVVIGAVADVLEHMAARGEGRLAHPVGALAAHLGEALGGAVHPLDHVMAADARIGAHALGHLGGGIVRTARAEIGRALGGLLGLVQHGLRLLHPRQIAGEIHILRKARRKPLAQGDGDVIGVQRIFGREERGAHLVLLADDEGLAGRPIKLLAHLHLDERTLLLDHDDEIEALRKFPQPLRLDGPDAAELVKAQAKGVGADFINPQIFERLPCVEIGFAGRDDADLRVGSARQDHLVDLVGA